ncbi:MAG: hypothetical protein RR361_07130 [Anaerovorax sp.]
MNNRTQYRIEQVIVHTQKLRRQRENYLLKALSTSCLLLTISLVGAFGVLTRGFPPGRPAMGTFGAVLLWGEADAYVVTGVMAFTAGVFITFLCLRFQSKKKHSSENTDKKQENEEIRPFRKE